MRRQAAKQPSSQAAKQPSSQAAKQPSSQAAKQLSSPSKLAPWKDISLENILLKEGDRLQSAASVLQFSPRVLHLLILDPMWSSSFFHWCPWIRAYKLTRAIRRKTNKKSAASVSDASLSTDSPSAFSTGGANP